MNAEDLRFYITSVEETRRIMVDIITILRTQEQTISDIVNHPSYQMYVPPPRNFSIPNYFGRQVPSNIRHNFSPTRRTRRRSYAQSPLIRPNRSPPTRTPLTSSPPGLSTPMRPNNVIGRRPETSPPPPPPTPPPDPASPSLDIINGPPIDIPGTSNSNTPRSSTNRLFGTNISASSTPSPNRGIDNTAQANPVAARIADLLGVALLNELNTAGLSPVSVRPTDSQIRQATELINYSSMFNPSTQQEPQYSRCPISHEEFTLNSRVYRIRHCGHYFEPQSLLTWFRTSVRCPVCRYDIRTHLTDYNHTHSVEEEDDTYNDAIEETSNEEELEEEIEEEIEESTSGGSSLNEFISNIREDQIRNPIGRNRRRVYRYQFDVTPFVTRALRGDAAGPADDAAGSAYEDAAGSAEPSSSTTDLLDISGNYSRDRYMT